MIFEIFQIESGEMPNFDAVLDHAKDFIEGKVDEPHVIENTETCTCRFQSCCYVSWSKFYIELWWEVFASSQLLKEWKLFWWKSKTEDDSQYSSATKLGLFGALKLVMLTLAL